MLQKYINQNLYNKKSNISIVSEDSKMFNKLNDLCFTFMFEVDHAFIEEPSKTLDIYLHTFGGAIKDSIIQGIKIISNNYKGKFNPDKDVKLIVRMDNNFYSGDNDISILDGFQEEINNVKTLLKKINSLKLDELDHITTY